MKMMVYYQVDKITATTDGLNFKHILYIPVDPHLQPVQLVPPELPDEGVFLDEVDIDTGNVEEDSNTNSMHKSDFVCFIRSLCKKENQKMESACYKKYVEGEEGYFCFTTDKGIKENKVDYDDG